MNEEEKIEFFQNAHIGDLISITWHTERGSSALCGFIEEASLDKIKAVGHDPLGLILPEREETFQPCYINLERVCFYAIYDREENGITGEYTQLIRKDNLWTKEGDWKPKTYPLPKVSEEE